MAENLHALFVPFPTEGHINGLLGLAQALANHGLLISFAYPARSHALLQQRKKLPQLHPSVRLCIFADGLPTDHTRIPDLQEVEKSLRVMQDSLKLLTHELSTGANPISCIVSDTFVPWTQDLANEVSLPRVEYWTSTATVYSMGFHMPELITRGNLPVKKNSWTVEAPLIDFIRGLPPFPVTELPVEFLMEDVSDVRFQFMVSAFSRAREAHMILANSMYELESNVFDALSDQIPISSVGPLFQPPYLAVKTDAPVDEAAPLSTDIKCLKWLDQQAASTVVYISLGSVSTFSPEETHGMALGLEASGYPFLWVIRADAVKGELADLLPEGYLSRTAERSMIIPWAPQPEVLKHKSIGAFLSHCGWNSTLESLWGGKAMIACPRAAEQRSNARNIVDNWKVGVELERKEDGSFSMEAVEAAIKSVMLKPETRQRALQVQQLVHQSVAEGGRSHKNVVNFLYDLKQRAFPKAKNL